MLTFLSHPQCVFFKLVNQFNIYNSNISCFSGVDQTIFQGRIAFIKQEIQISKVTKVMQETIGRHRN